MYLLTISLISVSFSAGMVFVLSQLVVDKETRMRESLKIMSMCQTAYGLSYIALQSTFVLFTSIVLTFSFLLGFSNPTETGGNPWILFFGTLFYGLGLLAEAMLLSTFFSDSKLSTQIGLYLLLLPTSIFLYVVSYST